jgi:hypothetical protein
MKSLMIGLFLVSLSSTSFARMGGISCGSGSNGTEFSAIFEGGRFMDSVFVSLNHDQLKPLMRIKDQNVQTQNESLGSMIHMGGCKRGTGDVMMTCQLRKGDVVGLNISYEVAGVSEDGFSEVIRVTKHETATQLDLSLTRVGDKAVLLVETLIQNEDQSVRPFVIKKTMGPLDNWFRCKDTPEEF